MAYKFTIIRNVTLGRASHFCLNLSIIFLSLFIYSSIKPYINMCITFIYPCSVSDANMPVNELVRLVRVYSSPWEEKSAALKKLHDEYESNQRQLNIAIKRLKLVESQVY